MTDYLSDLPREILLLIVKELSLLESGGSPWGLLHWSYTSTFFEHLISPIIIIGPVVYLHCKEDRDFNEDSGRFLKEIASGPYGHRIEKILFEVDYDGGFAFPSPGAEILPESVGTVLSNLHLFPSLELLRIRFFGYEYEMNDITTDETEADVIEGEEFCAYRAFTAAVYRALGQNEKIFAKGLELEGQQFNRVSSFADQSFRNFLSHLQTFSLCLVADEVDAYQPDYEANRCPEYVGFASELGNFFYDHLSHVTSLTIKASKRGPLGDRKNHEALALRKDHMPHLKYVDLEYIVVHTKLTDFLVGHATTLEHVILRECFVEHEDSKTEMDFYWEHFLDSLSNAGCSELRRFEILPVSPPFTRHEYMWGQQDPPIPQDLERGQRLFAYLWVEDENGYLHFHEDAIHASFKKGRDQKSYDRLMQIVDANCQEESCPRKRRRLE